MIESKIKWNDNSPIHKHTQWKQEYCSKLSMTKKKRKERIKILIQSQYESWFLSAAEMNDFSQIKIMMMMMMNNKRIRIMKWKMAYIQHFFIIIIIKISLFHLTWILKLWNKKNYEEEEKKRKNLKPHQQQLNRIYFYERKKKDSYFCLK